MQDNQEGGFAPQHCYYLRELNAAGNLIIGYRDKDLGSKDSIQKQ